MKLMDCLTENSWEAFQMYREAFVQRQLEKLEDDNVHLLDKHRQWEKDIWAYNKLPWYKKLFRCNPRNKYGWKGAPEMEMWYDKSPLEQYNDKVLKKNTDSIPNTLEAFFDFILKDKERAATHESLTAVQKALRTKYAYVYVNEVGEELLEFGDVSEES